MEGDKAYQNLNVFEELDNFVGWMYSQIKPFLKGNILELGSGIGTYSKKIIDDFPRSKIILSDIDRQYLEILQKRFKEEKNITIKKIGLEDPTDFRLDNLEINTVFAINVLEHIKDDIAALNNVYNVLERKGRFVFVVPTHKFLFNSLDQAVGHCRRYTKKTIIEKISKTPFTIRRIFYFNFLSMFVWYGHGNVFKRKVINKTLAKLLDRVIPLLKFLENHILRKKMGISLVVVLEKK